MNGYGVQQQLSKVLGDNVKRLRADQGLSLDALAKESGVSKSRLGQIEHGEANPSIATLWQIASALRVEFTALVKSEQPESVVVSRADVEPVVGEDGSCRTYPLFPFDSELGFETYLSEIEPGGSLHAEPHPEGTRETLTVAAGSLTIEVGGQTYTARDGDAIRFRADEPHDYRNDGDEPVVFSMIVAYPRKG